MKYLYIASIICFLFFQICSGQNFQEQIDKNTNAINEYYNVRQQSKDFPVDIDGVIKSTLDSTSLIKSQIIEILTTEKFALSEERMQYLYSLLNILKKKNDEYVRFIHEKNNRTKLKELKTKKNQAVKNIISTSSLIPTGEIFFKHKDSEYLGFIANLNIHNVSTYFIDNRGKKFISIGNLYNFLTQIKQIKKENVLMITNGGMYLPDLSAQGLLIQDGKTIKPANLVKEAYGNFFMQPNGIFFIDSLGGHVVTTDFYINNIEKIHPIHATQSGPMLVIDNEFHPRFNYNAPSKYIRSGVGIMNDGRILFVINRRPVNLFDFATVFKDLFGCKNALYLDGAISRMYLKTNNKNEKGGQFGPLIGITLKSTKQND